MFMISLVLSLLSCISCVNFEDQKEPSSQTQNAHFLKSQRCVKDGANVYIRCADGRQKVLALGYGEFWLVKNNRMAEAAQFCNEDLVKLTMNLRNVHFKTKVRRRNGVISESSPMTIQNECAPPIDDADIRKSKEYGNNVDYKIFVRQLNDPFPTDTSI